MTSRASCKISTEGRSQRADTSTMQLRRVALALGLAAGVLGIVPSAPAGAATWAATVRGFGAPTYGALPTVLARPIVDIAANPTASGYWLVAADGGIFGGGHAHFYGSTANLALHQPIVAIAATPTGRGYWLTASDGGIFSFGDARFYGSLGALHLWSPIVATAPTPSGRGYWLAAGDGGIFAFGDARFYGSVAGRTPRGVIDVVASRSGRGYAMLGADGTIYRFGDAPPASARPTSGRDAASFALTADGHGYWIVERSGRVDALGSAHGHGGSVPRGDVALGIARAPDGGGYWIVSVPSGPPLPANSGSGRRIVYSNAQQRVWTVEANGVVSHSWLVSGRSGLPPLGTFHVLWRRDPDPDGSLVLRHMQAFWQSPNGGWVGFHQIPQRRDGTPIEPDSLLGTPQSHGCIRLSAAAGQTLWDWASIGTTVVAVP